MAGLADYVRVAIDQDTCISCGACLEACPYDALEFNSDMKARLIWDKCRDDFSCIASCPVQCIYRVDEAPPELLATEGWYRLGDKSPEVLAALKEWREKYNVEADPVEE